MGKLAGSGVPGSAGLWSEKTTQRKKDPTDILVFLPQG